MGLDGDGGGGRDGVGDGEKGSRKSAEVGEAAGRRSEGRRRASDEAGRAGQGTLVRQIESPIPSSRRWCPRRGSKVSAASPTSASTSTSSSRTAPTSTGRAAAWSSTCRASAAELPEGVNPVDRARRHRRRLGVPVRAGRRDRPAQPRRPARRSGLVSALLRWPRSPGVAEVASIGGFVKQYQVNLDPEPARRLRHSRSRTSSTRSARATTTSRGGCSSSAGREYMVRGRGYLTSVDGHRSRSRSAPMRAARRSASATWRECSSGPTSGAASRSSTARAKSSAASSSCGSARTRCAVIDRVKAKLRERRRVAACRACAIVPTYDRSGLISESIAHAAAHADRGSDRRVAGHHRVPVPLPVGAGADPGAADRGRGGVHPDVLPRRHVQHHVARRPRARDRRARGCVDRDGGERLPARVRAGQVEARRGRRTDGPAARDRGSPRRSRWGARSSSRSPSSSSRSCRSSCWRRRKGACSGRWRSPRRWRWSLASLLSITLVPVLMAIFIRGRTAAARVREPGLAVLRRGCTSRSCALALRWKWAALLVNFAVVPLTIPLLFAHRQRVHAAALRRVDALHADRPPGHVDHRGDAPAAGAGQAAAPVP